MLAVFINTWKATDPESPGWMTGAMLHKICSNDNKNADGTPMVPTQFYDKTLYTQMRDSMVAIWQFTTTFAGLSGYDRMVVGNTVYTVLGFSSMETLKAYQTTTEQEALFAHYREIRDEMLALLKVELTINAPVETEHTIADIQCLNEAEIKSLLTGQ